MPTSISEEHGLAYMSDADLVVYSVGISTAGAAEIKMAKSNAKRKIIATTLDEEGLNETKNFIANQNLQDRIICKIEDVSKKLPYDDEYFDYIYARLVLHYLSKQQLSSALAELHRVLKTEGKLFVVVRSIECPDYKIRIKYDEKTGFSYSASPNTGILRKRYFHSTESICEALARANFSIVDTSSYSEQLYSGYGRKVLSKNIDHLIEVKAKK